MYGPNTNIVINGSITYFSECEAQFIVESIGMLLRRGLRAMEPKVEVHDAYNVLIDEGNQQMAWGVSDVNTWYRNAKGRIAQNWPFDLVRYWRQTREPRRGRLRAALSPTYFGIVSRAAEPCGSTIW